MIKAITLHQPYASLIAMGLKQFETRSWATGPLQPLVIHAAKRPMRDEDWLVWLKAHKLADPLIEDCGLNSYDLPLGKAVAVCRLWKCRRMTMNIVEGRQPENINIDHVDDLEQAVGLWQPGRYAWQLRDVVAMPEPIPAQGKQGLWNFPHPELLPELPPFKWGGNHAA